MRAADKSNARFALIVGDDELKREVVSVKDLEKGDQKEIPMDSLTSEIKSII